MGNQLRHMEQRVEQGDDNTLKANVATLKAMLRDLHGNRQNSVKDLRNKSTALDIDNSCRKVTAQVATALCGEQAKKLASSASAPTLGGSSKMTSSGTGWKPSTENSGNPQQGDVEHRQNNGKGHGKGHHRP